MKRAHNSRLGAAIAGAILLAVAAIEYFAASAPAGANVLTALMGSALLVAGVAGWRVD